MTAANTNSAPLPYAPSPAHVPLRERINARMIVFIAVVLALLGTPIYWYIDSSISHGIKDLGNGYKQVDLKAMSLFPFDQQNGLIEDIPLQWRNLDGQKVVMYGEMWSPSESGDDIHAFQLCYSIAKCCFSGPPQVQHFIDSLPAKRGGTVPYYSGLVKVTGTLHVHLYRGDSKVQSVYQMNVDSITPA